MLPGDSTAYSPEARIILVPQKEINEMLLLEHIQEVSREASLED